MFWHLGLPEQATPDDKSRALRDMALAKLIGEHLERAYPGHFFRSEVDSRAGLVKISFPLLPKTFSYVVHLTTLRADPAMRCITRAAGELLERFNLPRGKYRSELWEEASAKHWRTKNGIMSEFNAKTGERKFVLPGELAR